MYNLIINFGGQDWQLEMLKQKITSSDQSVKVINLSKDGIEKGLTEEERSYFEKIDNTSRIYIIDHSRPNSTSLSSVHYQELGDFLIKNIKNIKPELHSNSLLKISLIACHAGVGDQEGLKSFGGLLHRYLGQNHHIPTEVHARKLVSMINDSTPTEGKKVTTLFNYAMMNIAYDLGIPQALFNPQAKVYHQKPGSKIAFVWDKYGEQKIIDGYVNSYFEKLNAVRSSLLELLDKEQLDPAQFESLLNISNELAFFLGEGEEKDVAGAKRSLLLLNQLQANLSNYSDDNKYKNAFNSVNTLIDFASHSIGNESQNTVFTSININDQPVEIEKNINNQIAENVIKPVNNKLREFPKTENEKPIKKITQQFLQHLSNTSQSKLSSEIDNVVEREIAKELVNILDLTLQKNDAKQIDKMIENLIAKIKGNAPGNAWLKGASRGLAEAHRIGGLTALRDTVPLTRFRANENSENTQILINHCEEFQKAISTYLLPNKHNPSTA